MPLAVSHSAGICVLLQWGEAEMGVFWLLPEIVIIYSQSGSSNLRDKGEWGAWGGGRRVATC